MMEDCDDEVHPEIEVQLEHTFPENSQINQMF